MIEGSVKKVEVRSISLRAPAFHGEGVEPPQLRFRGLDLPSFPVGVERPPLHCTQWFLMRRFDVASFLPPTTVHLFSVLPSAPFPFKKVATYSVNRF
jgi:hypothetical protein